MTGTPKHPGPCQAGSVALLQLGERAPTRPPGSGFRLR
jgi:hypothetical protein